MKNARTRLVSVLCVAAWSLTLYGCHPADTATPHLDAGAKLFDSGQADAAIVELQEGLRLNPAHAGGHLVLGRAYSQKKDYARYEAECREAIRLKPEWNDPYVDLGQCLILLHRYEEAVVPLNTALKIAPADPFAHYYLGNALNKAGKRTEARQQWQTAVQSGVARVVEGARKQLTKYP